MPKHGVVRDYDLMANDEPSAKDQTCEVCGDAPMRFQWSDYSGEAMCRSCGTPYQLKWGLEEMQEEGDYPYLNLRDEWVPVVREYHEETGRFAPLGRYLSIPEALHSDYEAFVRWVREHHPQFVNESA